VSGQLSGESVDLKAVSGAEVDSGVAHGGVLLAFTEAVMRGEGADVERTRAAVAAALGSEGVVDASAVIAMFNVVDRVADATGIPIDEGMVKELRYEIGAELGMQALAPEKRAAR